MRPSNNDIQTALQPPVRISYNSRLERGFTGRMFDLQSAQGRRELRLVYWFIQGLLIIGILAVSAYYFLAAEIEERDSVRIILLFSFSLSYVASTAVCNYLTALYTDDVDLSQQHLTSREIDCEFEKRLYYFLNVVAAAVYVTFLVLAYNNIGDMINVFVSVFCFAIWQYSYLRFGLFLPKLNPKRSFPIYYSILGVFTCLSLLGSSLALVDLS